MKLFKILLSLSQNLKSILWLPLPLLPGSIFCRRAPLLQVLHAPPLPRTAELQDGEGHPRASGGVVAPAASSGALFSPPLSVPLKRVSPGVTWAFEACLRKKKGKAVKETVHKDMAEILMIAIELSGNVRVGSSITKYVNESVKLRVARRAEALLYEPPTL